MDAGDVLDRVRALDHLFNETVTVEVTQGEAEEWEEEGRWHVEWRSGGETVLYANCADEDTARVLSSVPDMLHVMRLVMAEEEFMGQIPSDIVDTCQRAMTNIFTDEPSQ